MARMILVGAGLATVLSVGAAAPAVLADTTSPSPKPTADTAQHKRGARMCKRIPKAEARVAKLTATDPLTRGVSRTGCRNSAGNATSQRRWVTLGELLGGGLQRILAVDDDPAILRALRTSLRGRRRCGPRSRGSPRRTSRRRFRDHAGRVRP
jgi:hypothetical protein